MRFATKEVFILSDGAVAVGYGCGAAFGLLALVLFARYVENFWSRGLSIRKPTMVLLLGFVLYCGTRSGTLLYGTFVRHLTEQMLFLPTALYLLLMALMTWLWTSYLAAIEDEDEDEAEADKTEHDEEATSSDIAGEANLAVTYSPTEEVGEASSVPSNVKAHETTPIGSQDLYEQQQQQQQQQQHHSQHHQRSSRRTSTSTATSSSMVANSTRYSATHHVRFLDEQPNWDNDDDDARPIPEGNVEDGYGDDTLQQCLLASSSSSPRPPQSACKSNVHHSHHHGRTHKKGVKGRKRDKTHNIIVITESVREEDLAGTSPTSTTTDNTLRRCCNRPTRKVIRVVVIVTAATASLVIFVLMLACQEDRRVRHCTDAASVASIVACWCGGGLLLVLSFRLSRNRLAQERCISNNNDSSHDPRLVPNSEPFHASSGILHSAMSLHAIQTNCIDDGGNSSSSTTPLNATTLHRLPPHSTTTICGSSALLTSIKGMFSSLHMRTVAAAGLFGGYTILRGVVVALNIIVVQLWSDGSNPQGTRGYGLSPSPAPPNAEPSTTMVPTTTTFMNSLNDSEQYLIPVFYWVEWVVLVLCARLLIGPPS